MRLALLVLAAAVLFVPVVSAAWGMPEPLTERGRTVTEIYEKIAVVGVLVFVFVFSLLVWILWRYRETSGVGRATHEAHRGSIKAEMLWTIVPLAIMLWIGVMSYAGLVELDQGIDLEDHEMAVTVIGSQWLWTFDYGGYQHQGATRVDERTGEIDYLAPFHLPADTKILVNVTGADVIHAFNIMDENRAFVAMSDANPYGPHQVIQQVYEFPAGTYYIQCKEMCMNPGHAYMRGQLIVEPMADFQAWLAEQRIIGDADFVAGRFHVTAQGNTLATDANTTIVKGGRVLLDVENTGTSPVTVNSPGGTRNVTVAPGATELLYFDTAVEGDFTVTSSTGGSLAFTAITAELVAVDLADFRLVPPNLDLQAGTTYLFQVRNVHTAPHNVWIGELGSQPKVGSPTIAGGQQTSFTWTAEAGDWDMWCTVAGHASAGMVGTVTVA